MEKPVQSHILIVEDSPDLQILLGRLLIKEGYQLSRAENGRQALDLLQSMPTLPDLILLDIMMPVMGGVEFYEELKKISRLSQIPVVVMTADPNSQAKVTELGVAAFVRKPIKEIDWFLDTIERCRLHA